MDLYVYERQMGFSPTDEPPRPGADGGGMQRYPDGVEGCSSPEVYSHVPVTPVPSTWLASPAGGRQ